MVAMKVMVLVSWQMASADGAHHYRHTNKPQCTRERKRLH